MICDYAQPLVKKFQGYQQSGITSWKMNKVHGVVDQQIKQCMMIQQSGITSWRMNKVHGVVEQQIKQCMMIMHVPVLA